MKTLTLKIPDALVVQQAISLEELSKEAQREIAFHYFCTGRLSSGQAARMAGMNRADFLLAAGCRGMPVTDLDSDDLARELAVATTE